MAINFKQRFFVTFETIFEKFEYCWHIFVEKQVIATHTSHPRNDIRRECSLNNVRNSGIHEIFVPQAIPKKTSLNQMGLLCKSCKKSFKCKPVTQGFWSTRCFSRR